MPHISLAAINVCEKRQEWRVALGLIGMMNRAKVGADIILYCGNPRVRKVCGRERRELWYRSCLVEPTRVATRWDARLAQLDGTSAVIQVPGTIGCLSYAILRRPSGVVGDSMTCPRYRRPTISPLSCTVMGILKSMRCIPCSAVAGASAGAQSWPWAR